MNFTTYDTKTHQFKRNIEVNFEEIDLQLMQGESYVIGVFDPALHYVSAGVGYDRLVLPVTAGTTEIVADGVDTATVSGLPDPCVVTIDDVPYNVAGGVLTFRSVTPGDYEVAVKHWPYLDWDTTITVVEAA